MFQVAHGAAIQRKEIDNIPCVDVDSLDGDCNCDGSTPAVLLGTEKEFVLKEGNTELDVSPDLNSSHSEQENLEKDSRDPRSTSPGLELRDSCVEAPSPANGHLNCALSNSPLTVLFKFSLNYILNSDMYILACT